MEINQLELQAQRKALPKTTYRFFASCGRTAYISSKFTRKCGLQNVLETVARNARRPLAVRALVAHWYIDGGAAERFPSGDLSRALEFSPHTE